MNRVEGKDCALISYLLTQLGSKLIMSLKHCPEVEKKCTYNIQVPVSVPVNPNAKPGSSGICVSG